MSVPGVAPTVSGIDSLDILRQNLAIARGFEPMTRRGDAGAARPRARRRRRRALRALQDDHALRRQGRTRAARLSDRTRSFRSELHGDGMIAIPLRPLGKTGAKVSALGVGGHHLGRCAELRRGRPHRGRGHRRGRHVLRQLLGVQQRPQRGLARGARSRRADSGTRSFLMTKVCTHGRDAGLAMPMLDESLRRLRTDHLDLWQVHGVGFDNDPELAYRKAACSRRSTRPSAQGKVRFVGFTGHKDPTSTCDDHARVSRSIPCRCRSTASTPAFAASSRRVLPEATERGIAVLGMKPMTGQGRPDAEGRRPPPRRCSAMR